MLSRPLILNESDDQGRGLGAATSPPVLPLVDEGDDDVEAQSGVFSPPAPPWSSSSSSPLPPCDSSSSSAPCLISPPVAPPFTCLPPPLPALCPPHPMSLPSSPPSSLSSPSLPPPSVSSAPFISPSPPVSPPLPVAPCLLSSAPSSTPTPIPPPPSSSSTPTFTLTVPLSPPFLDSSPPVSSAPGPLPPLLHHQSSCLVSPPPASSVFSPPPLSAHIPPPVSPLLHPNPVASSSIPSPPAPPPPPQCPCSSLLPRLLSAHRLEVRRLLRGALASLGRRLDSLERRSRRKRRKKRGSGQRGRGAAWSPSLAASSSSTSSCSPALIQPVFYASSSSDSEDSSTPPLPSCFTSSSLQSEQGKKRSQGDEEARGRKRRRMNVGEEFVFPENREDVEEEEDPGRFIGQMAVSFRRGGAEKEAPLMLHSFNQRKDRRREVEGTGQSEKAVSVVRRNGYRAPLLQHSSSSQDALLLLQSAQSVRTYDQSEASLCVSSSQWCFSDFTPPFSLSANQSALRLWLRSSSLFSPASILRLSAVAMETVSESVRGGACRSPLRPLKDWTAPPSLSSDHCYVRTSVPRPTCSTWRQQKQRANHSPRGLHLPRQRPLPLPPCSANGLSAPFPSSQSAVGSEFLSTNGEHSKRVSQIRIRRASPRETPLTPMGLPKVKRLKKKEFSLEEIYTNKNYKSPTANRSLETIFEEPREKDGALLLIGQQRRRRLLLFPDFTQPRKRKRPQGVGLPFAMGPRKRAAARRHCHSNGDDDVDLDVMLVERLSALEDFLTRQGLDV
ncbi:rho guanine nucleotide exchange factor 5 [Toxotes jaculatrix]|uniref:rho guanine nucleotide exchange factor 5 n=1 Tax=Toxotes jaculatrix TaxID=941984 RepID=UPI001B3AB2F4|nr:rho guanine nucleotide exchange factor 5 [Toxotes jaculatrix]XP_040914478.1 rho guanine nucleotide exchange factor 5 [Toxotes jaculatrix]